MPRPDADLVALADAVARVHAATRDLSDADARGPSRLPGWTRGHVLTHLARNGDGNAFILAGAAFGAQWPQYPGGLDQRAADIEVGAGRPIAELLADVAGAQRRFSEAAAHVPHARWALAVPAWLPERRTVADVPASRRRELLVHLVDLDVGVTPASLPEDFVAANREWLATCRTVETWPDARW